MVILLGSLLAAGCAQRDERHPIAIAIAGTPAGVATSTAPTTSTAPKASAAATTDAKDAMVELTRCLRQNGVDVPDPGSPEEKGWRYTGDQATLQKAFKACEEYSARIPNPYDDPKVRDQMVQFARCMREHGIDMPDPPQQNTGLDYNDPMLQQAAKECAETIPGWGGRQ